MASMTEPRPRIAVTMGDPAGIGPEVCLHLLANEEIAGLCVPVVFGDAAILRRVSGAAKLPLRAAVLSRDEWQTGWAQIDQPTILDFKAIDPAHVAAGQVSAATG